MLNSTQRGWEMGVKEKWGDGKEEVNGNKKS